MDANKDRWGHAALNDGSIDMESGAKGLAAAAVSAASYGVITTAAKFAYTNGTEPMTFVAFRAAIGLLAAVVLVVFLGRRVSALPRTSLLPLGVTIVGMFLIYYGYMSSVQFIPVSLAALIFYSFPLMVLTVTSVAERRWPPATSIAAFSMAFVGLAMALGPSLDVLDWRGLLGAGLASVGGALMMIFGSKAARSLNVALMALLSHLVAVPVTAVVIMAAGGPVYPVNDIGWLALCVAGAAYVSGTFFQFAAVRFADPAPASMIFNLEPLVTLVIAAVLLGERLQIAQYLGGALVLVGIVAVGRRISSES